MGLLKKSRAWVATLGVVLWPLAVLASAWLFRHPENKNVLTVEAARWALQIAAGCLLFFVIFIKNNAVLRVSDLVEKTATNG
jgi:adenosine/AMP kinase